jgi:hypothetical protein
MHETVPTIKIKALDPEQGKFIVINASDFDKDKHEMFDAPVVVPPPPVAVPPPPSTDPLDALSKDWRNGDVVKLRALAAAVGGRSVENKAQAIQVIEAALAARK